MRRAQIGVDFDTVLQGGGNGIIAGFDAARIQGHLSAFQTFVSQHKNILFSAVTPVVMTDNVLRSRRHIFLSGVPLFDILSAFQGGRVSTGLARQELTDRFIKFGAGKNAFDTQKISS